MENEYCIIANIKNPRGYSRKGAKAWMISAWIGGGYERAEWVMLSKGGRFIRRWMATKNMCNFRVQWCPPKVKNKTQDLNWPTGSKKEMQEIVDLLNERFR